MGWVQLQPLQQTRSCRPGCWRVQLWSWWPWALVSAKQSARRRWTKSSTSSSSCETPSMQRCAGPGLDPGSDLISMYHLHSVVYQTCKVLL